MNRLINIVIIGINVAILGCMIKLYSELVKKNILETIK